jgi:nicotinate-nucleotide adenylyltransferase
MTAPRPALPPAGFGQTVGLFGGSFDPPHAGHRHASDAALSRLGLDRVWWLVTPGNPLKDTGGLPAAAERLAAAARVARHPRVTVTDVESRLGTRFTADTIAELSRLRPDLRFVLVIGADNWATFHRWQGWRRIAAMVPIAVIDRPGATFRALSSPAARVLAACRVDDRSARTLARRSPPAWVFVPGKRVPVSSTMLRSARRAGRPSTPVG